MLDGVAISTLVYADDVHVVILTRSGKQMQRALDQLNMYCEKKKLQVFTDRTKIVIFRLGKASPNCSFNLAG